MARDSLTELPRHSFEGAVVTRKGNPMKPPLPTIASVIAPIGISVFGLCVVLVVSLALIGSSLATAEPLPKSMTTAPISSAPIPSAPTTSDPTPRLPKNHEEVQQVIFFAVLEGLYLDGVDTATAKMLSATDAKTGAPLFFVYSCPICMPALDAVRLYAGRPEFYGSKAAKSTFGKGLSESVRAQLALDDPRVRIEAFQTLVLGWIDRYLHNMRLTAEESAEWASWIRGLREKGNARLASYLDQGGAYAEVYRDWEKCPSCEGANGAMEN